MSEDSSPTFLFDDFFSSSSDLGVKHLLHIRGREIPIHTKRNLSLEDFQVAQNKAVKKRFNAATNKYEIESMDEDAFTNAVLPKLIVSWPFVDAAGKPVPITEKNIRALHIDVATELGKVVEKVLNGRQQETDFFANPCVEASSSTPPASQILPLVPSASG